MSWTSLGNTSTTATAATMCDTSSTATPTTEPEPMVIVPTSPVKKARKRRAKRDPIKPRAANAWVEHLKAWRLQNADRISAEKLDVGQCAKLARESYTKKN